MSEFSSVVFCSVGLFLCFCCCIVSGCDNTGKVCFYGEAYDVNPSTCNGYVSYVAGLGYTTEIINTATWNSMTTDDFSECNAIIFCDPRCSTDESVLETGAANSDVWGAAIDGNILISGGDEGFHGYYQGQAGAVEFLSKAMDFVLSDTECDYTGLYVSLSCYYWTQEVELGLMTYFGDFEVDLRGSCDNVHIVADVTAIDEFNGLEDSDMAPWGCAITSTFGLWPDDFLPFAIDTSAGLSDGSAYEFPDGTEGKPVILTRGAITLADHCTKYDFGLCDGEPCDCALDDMTNCNICHDNQGCSQCDNGYWKLDLNHKCVSCDMFGEGCMFCQDFNGCGQCKSGYHRVHNTVCDVWECVKDEENIDCNTDTITMHLDSDQCIMPCYDLTGPACSCADICDCQVCHEGQGCSQCKSGYFKVNDHYPCINCQEYFGEACLHCQDGHGCGQCADGYSLQYDDTCDLYKCV